MNLNDNSIKNIFEQWNNSTDDYFIENPNELTKVIDLEHLFHYDNVKNLDILPCIDFVYKSGRELVDMLDNIGFNFKPGKSNLVKVRLKKDRECIGIVEFIDDQGGQDWFERAKLVTIEPELISYFLLENSQDMQGNTKVAKQLIAEIPTRDEIPLISDSNTPEENIAAFEKAFRGIKRVVFPSQQENNNDYEPYIEYNEYHGGIVRLTHEDTQNNALEEAIMIGAPVSGLAGTMLLYSVNTIMNPRDLSTFYEYVAPVYIDNTGSSPALTIEDYLIKEYSSGGGSAVNSNFIASLFDWDGIYATHREQGSGVDLTYNVVDITTAPDENTSGQTNTVYSVEITNNLGSTVHRNATAYFYDSAEDVGDTNEAIGSATTYIPLSIGGTDTFEFIVENANIVDTALYVQFSSSDSPR